MKKITTKSMAFFLAILTIAVLAAACGNSTGSNTSDTTTVPDISGSDITTLDPSKVSKLPETYDWGGEEYNILGRDGGAYHMFTNFEIYAEDAIGDVVSSAVWTRNQTLQDKYNFIVKSKLVSSVASYIKTLYDSGEDAYDLVIYQACDIQAHAIKGYLNELEDIPNINIDNESWNPNIVEQLRFGGKLYYGTSDFLLQDKNRYYIMVYNRELAKDYEYGYLEEMVDNNTWTLENMEKIIRNYAHEVDGIEGIVGADAYGIGADCYNTFAVLALGAGFRWSTMNEQGYPELLGATDKMLSILDRVLSFASDELLVLYPEEFTAKDYNSTTMVFKEERCLILACFLSNFNPNGGTLTDTELEYGFLPYPKYDTNQETYLTDPNVQNSSLFAIPITVEDLDAAGFFLQAISEESNRVTMPAYYETRCKLRNAYDQRCSDMLDVIFEHVVYDTVCMSNIGGLRGIVNDLIPSLKANVYARAFAQNQSKAQTEIDKIIEAYNDR